MNNTVSPNTIDLLSGEWLKDLESQGLMIVSIDKWTSLNQDLADTRQTNLFLQASNNLLKKRVK